MPGKTFRWTRRRYRKAHSLSRFVGRWLYELPDQPELVRRYFELWEQHPQREDPLLTPMQWRPRYCPDDIPF